MSLVIGLMSCSDDSIAPHVKSGTNTVSQSESNRVAQLEDSDRDLLRDKIFAWESENPSESTISFNYETLYTSVVDEFEGEAIVAEQVGYDIENPVNYVKAFYIGPEGEIIGSMILKNSIVADNVNQIEYMDINEQVLLSVTLNFNTQTSTVNLTNPPGSWGQNTMDCVQDVYSNHGWVSLWASIQTAFIPHTAVAFAAVCAYINYQ